MNRSNYSTIGLLIIAFVVSMLFITESVRADFTFGERVNLKAIIPVIDPEYDTIDCFSYDGLEIYLESVRPGGSGGCDIWVVKRESIDDDWNSIENLGYGINSSKDETHACISGDGLTLYFTSDQPDGSGDFDIWMASRSTRNDPWNKAVNIGSQINHGGWDISPWISAEGLEFYFCSDRPGGYGNLDIYLSNRLTMNKPWDEAVNLGPVVNSTYNEVNVHLSPDGLLLLFSELTGETPRPGGHGGADIWMTRRTNISSPWQAPVNLGPLVNRATHDKTPCISIDGSMLYFTTITDDQIWDNWQVPILPICDFNGDSIVDIADVGVMVENWYTSNPLCDIGPMPWGDGIVDDKDLKVLTEHLSTAPRPIANWKLDEEDGRIAYDSAGNYDADLHGGPHWRPYDGMKGGALQLDGTDEYVCTPFILNPAECSFSIFAWIKSNTRGQVIIAQNDKTGTRWLWTDPSYGRLASWLMHPSFKPLMSPSTVTDGQWHHVGLVYDFQRLRRYLYVDGLKVDRDTEAAGGVGSNGPLYFGAEKTLGTGTFFSGLIDDVRVYKGALTDDEVAVLAQ